MTVPIRESLGTCGYCRRACRSNMYFCGNDCLRNYQADQADARGDRERAEVYRSIAAGTAALDDAK